MISKNKIKLINSLKLKKYRQRYGLFTAEGKKNVIDLLNSGLSPNIIFADSDFLLSSSFGKKTTNKTCIIETNKTELKKISNLKTPSSVFAVFEVPEIKNNFTEIFNDLCIFCDNIQNPGNLGTIIRTAEWFGIKNILCSRQTVDVYNNKVVQATSGAIGRVNVRYVDTDFFFEKAVLKQIDIYGMFLSGEDIFETKLSKNGIIVIGNEGKGIGKIAGTYVNRKLFIPTFPEDNNKPESLNVSAATAIACAEFRRRKRIIIS